MLNKMALKGLLLCTFATTGNRHICVACPGSIVYLSLCSSPLSPTHTASFSLTLPHTHTASLSLTLPHTHTASLSLSCISIIFSSYLSEIPPSVLILEIFSFDLSILQMSSFIISSLTAIKEKRWRWPMQKKRLSINDVTCT